MQVKKGPQKNTLPPLMLWFVAVSHSLGQHGKMAGGLLTEKRGSKNP